MKNKKIIITSIGILIILLFITIIIKNNNDNIITIDGVKYALTLDGNDTNTVPSKGNYEVNVTCTNATGKWDYDNWILKLYNLTGNVLCDVAFATVNTTNNLLNNKVMDLSVGTCSNTSYTTGSTCTNNSGTWTTTTGSGYCTLSGYPTEATCKAAGVCSNSSYSTSSTCVANGGSWTVGSWYAVFNENGFRYEGKDPNNYIWFNGEMWRIIGVFDSTNHGQSGNLVKIIRADSIGTLVWHITSDDITWGTGTTCNSSLCHLLNENYYNGIDYPYDYTSTSNYCSSSYGYTPSKCNYSKTGITSTTYRNMIATARWNNTAYISLGTASVTYGYDTKTTNTYTGKIGLMYISDYGYTPLSSVCARTISLNDYECTSSTLDNCISQNWLMGKGLEWTISQRTVSEGRLLSGYGATSDSNLFVNYSIRPSLYLSSSVYVLDGDGSYNDPYIIAM